MKNTCNVINPNKTAELILSDVSAEYVVFQ